MPYPVRILYLWCILMVALFSCKTEIKVESSPSLVIDPSGAYLSPQRARIDSLFRARPVHPDSLVMVEEYKFITLAPQDESYFRIKFMEGSLNNRVYTYFDSASSKLMRDSMDLVPELDIEFKTLIARRLGEQGDFEASDSLFETATREAGLYFKPQHDLPLKIREKHAEMWRYDANNPEEAMKVLVQMDSILQLREDFGRFHRNQLYTLATTNRILGKFDEALANALLLRGKLAAQQPVDSAYYYSVSKVLANIYTDMEDPREANRYFEEHIKFNLAKNRLKAHDLINFAIQLSRNYQFDQADIYLSRSLPMLKSAEDSFYYNRTLAFHLMNLEKNEEAKPYLFKVMAYCRKKYDYQLCPICTQWLGELYDLTGKPDSAIYYYRQAVSFICGKKFDQVRHPDLMQKKDIELYYSMLIRALVNKYQESGETANLKKASEYTRLVLDYFDEVSLRYTGIDRLINFQLFHEAFGHGAQVHYLLWQKTGDTSHLRQTLAYLERCKSSDWDNRQLLHSLDLDEKQRNLLGELHAQTADIHELELELYQNQDARQAALLKEAVSRKDQSLRRIRDSFPDFYKLVSSPTGGVDLDALWKQSGSTPILYFHWNRLNTYEYVFHDGRVKLNTYFNSLALKDSIDRYTTLVRKVISRSPEDDVGEKMLSRHLFQLWMAPYIDPGQDRLIVIPDGPVHGLSLARILQDQDKNAGPRVTYSFSLAEALAPRPEPRIQTILAVAYGHAEETEQFASLPGTIKEVDALKTQYPGAKIIYLKHHEATKANFLKYAPHSDILYLATHAQSDPYNRFRNRLVFHGPDKKNEWLTAVEIMQLNLRPQVVVLSACESGLGSYYRGGGNLSLVKAFKAGNGRNRILAAISQVQDFKLLNDLYQEY